VAPPVFAVGDLKAAGGIEFTAGKTGCAAKRAGIRGRLRL